MATDGTRIISSLAMAVALPVSSQYGVGKDEWNLVFDFNQGTSRPEFSRNNKKHQASIQKSFKISFSLHLMR